jgi:hypothetical protein
MRHKVLGHFPESVKSPVHHNIPLGSIRRPYVPSALFDSRLLASICLTSSTPGCKVIEAPWSGVDPAINMGQSLFVPGTKTEWVVVVLLNNVGNSCDFWLQTYLVKQNSVLPLGAVDSVKYRHRFMKGKWRGS